MNSGQYADMGASINGGTASYGSLNAHLGNLSRLRLVSITITILNRSTIQQNGPGLQNCYAELQKTIGKQWENHRKMMVSWNLMG